MVHCGPHEGRHTGVLVARKLDEVINSLDLPEIFKCMTTDNASNMKNACRDSFTIDKHLSWFDHTLNLVVNAGINSVAVIKNSVEKFKKLVAGCHKSNLYCERIKRACSDLNSSASTTEPGRKSIFAIYLSIYLTIFLVSIYQSYLSIKFAIYLSIYLSIYL